MTPAQDLARFDVRVAGGTVIKKNVGLAMACAQAYATVQRGYVVWIRERTRVSWMANTLRVEDRHGRVVVLNADPSVNRFVDAATRIIDELQEDNLPDEGAPFDDDDEDGTATAVA